MQAIINRIPSLTDAELVNLEGNALRLSQGGTAKQVAAAAAVLPAVAAEIASRKALRKQALAVARAERRAERAKAGALPRAGIEG